MQIRDLRQPSSSPPGSSRTNTLAGLLCLVWYVPSYVAFYKLGIALYFRAASASTLWLSDAFVLAVLLLTPRRKWPTLLVAGVLASVAINIHNLQWGIETGLIDNGEALLCALLAQRWIDGPFDITRLRHTLALLSAMLAGSAIASLFGAALVVNTVPGHDFSKAFRLWWYSDVVGDIVLAPLLLAWSRVNNFEIRRMWPKQTAELAILIACALTISFWRFNLDKSAVTNWLLPILLWASLRFHPRYVLLIVLTTTLYAVFASVAGLGPFVHGNTTTIDTLIELQSCIVILTMSVLIVSSLTSDRNRTIAEYEAAEKALTASHAQIVDILESMTDFFFSLDRSYCFTYANAALLTYRNRARDELMGKSLWSTFPGLENTIMAEQYRSVMETRVPVSFTVFHPVMKHWFDFRIYPTDDGIAVYSILVDDRVRAETEREDDARRQHEFVRDVLGSVTDGRLTLCLTEADLPPALAIVEAWVDLSIPGGRKQIRTDIQRIAEAAGFERERWQDLMTAADEANMNAIMHAVSGRCQISSSACTIQARVEDHGAGIDVQRLHRATLERGYTTAGSFGHGMKMILHTADRTYLLTGPEGTIVVVEQDRVPPPPPTHSWL